MVDRRLGNRILRRGAAGRGREYDGSEQRDQPHATDLNGSAVYDAPPKWEGRWGVPGGSESFTGGARRASVMRSAGSPVPVRTGPLRGDLTVGYFSDPAKIQ